MAVLLTPPRARPVQLNPIMKKEKRVRAKGSENAVSQQGEKAKWVWEVVPVLNQAMVRAKAEDLHLLMSKIGADIDAARNKPFAEGLAMVRGLHLAIEHHPDLALVSNALRDIEEGTKKLADFRRPFNTGTESGLAQYWLSQYLTETAKLPLWTTWSRLEGLAFFVARAPECFNIALSIDVVARGFATLDHFDEETTWLADGLAKHSAFVAVN